jgi:hypothetical protein
MALKDHRTTGLSNDELAGKGLRVWSEDKHESGSIKVKIGKIESRNSHQDKNKNSES